MTVHIFNYKLKQEPGETESPFGGVSMVSRRKRMQVEVDPDALTTEQQEIWEEYQANKRGFIGLQIETDVELTVDSLLAMLAKQISEAKAKLQKRREEEEDRRREEQRQREDTARIEWDENGKVICNLYQKVMAISALGIDHRFRHWIKEITGVDQTKSNGYMFEGQFLNDHLVEIDRRDRIFLAAATHGSWKYQTTHYRVVLLLDGKLEQTDFYTDNRDRGWALKLREPVTLWVNKLSREAGVDEFAPLREAAQSGKANVIVNRVLLTKLLERVS